MKEKDGKTLSRREFAQRAALLSATATLTSAQAVLPAGVNEASLQVAGSGPKLTEAGQAEADARYQQIIALYGNRFDDAQKSELKRMCAELQPSLESIRHYTLRNGDAPALYLKPLVEREKKAPPNMNSAPKHS